jgi:hypothetical protein
VNYLAELKAFYDRLELNPLPSPAIALWHALMSIANKTGWQQEFTAAVSVLVLKSGLNAQAVKRARNRLEQDGYISWRSRGGNQSAVYHLHSLVVQNPEENVPQSGPQNVPQNAVVQNPEENVPQYEPQNEPQTVPQSEPQSVPINKHKRNKTKSIPPLSPAKRLEEFLCAYPKDSYRYLAEHEYVCLLLTKKVTEDELICCAKNYAEACKIEQMPERYIKNAENFLKDMVFEKYLPGKYKRPSERTQKPRNSFHNFVQRDTDYDAIALNDLRKRLGNETD